jgi:hypothetical protein
LERVFVIVIEYIEREHSPWSLEGCRIPFETQELTVVFNPSGALRAFAELDVDAVDPIPIHNNKGLSLVRRGARSVFVASIEAISQTPEG